MTVSELYNKIDWLVQKLHGAHNVTLTFGAEEYNIYGLSFSEEPSGKVHITLVADVPEQDKAVKTNTTADAETEAQQKATKPAPKRRSTPKTAPKTTPTAKE